MTHRNIIITAASGSYTGAAKMAHLYGLALREAGWGVTYVVGTPDKNGVETLAARLTADGFKTTVEHGFYNSVTQGPVKRLKKLLMHSAPDLVVSFVQADVKVVSAACASAGVPFIVSDQTLHRFYGPRPIRLLKEIAFGMHMRRARFIVATSEAVAQDAVERFGCDPRRVSIVPNGIKTALYHAPRHPRTIQRGGYKSLPLRLVTVGRLDEQKGHLQLIEALAICRRKGREVELSIAGDITPNHPESLIYKTKIHKLIQGLNLQTCVHLLGWQTNVARILGQCDAYIHAALWEGPSLPLALLEAMACGLPAIMTDCAGRPPDFLDGVHGWLVRAGCPEELASAIEEMYQLTDAERWKMGARCARMVSRRYDVSVTASEFIAVCESALLPSALSEL